MAAWDPAQHPSALIDRESAKAFLEVTKPGEKDDLIDSIIDAAGEWMETYCCRPFRERAYANARLQGHEDQKFYPINTPIKVGTVTLELNGKVVPVWQQESDGDPRSFEVVLAGEDEDVDIRTHLWRGIGWLPEDDATAILTGTHLLGGFAGAPQLYPPGQTWYPYNIKLSYTGGYAFILAAGVYTNSVPPDLQLVNKLLVQKLFRDATRKSSDVAAMNLPSGGSITVIDQAMPKAAAQILKAWTRCPV